MNKISFFYDVPSVFKVALRALEFRKFNIVEVDEENGVIKAKSKKNILKPAISLELKLKMVSESQTSLDINSTVNKDWHHLSDDESKVESKFINTLYKCFDNI